MTPEQLTQPRYEVIADFPNSANKIGDIVEGNEGGTFHMLTISEYDPFAGKSVDTDHFYSISMCDKYPAIFRPLKWWQKRKIEDMPEYIKSYDKPINHEARYSNVVIKCGVDIFWNSSKFSTKNDWVNAYGGTIIQCFMPATIEEYVEYTTKKNK